MLERTFHRYKFRTNTATFQYTNSLFHRIENKSNKGNEKRSKHTKRTYFTLHRITLHVTSQSSSRNNSHTTHSNLSITHTEHASACCGTTVSQPASQQAVTSCSTACPVLCCAVCCFSPLHIFPCSQTSHHRILERPTVRWAQWRKLGDVCAIRIRWQWVPARVAMMHPPCELFTACFHFQCWTTVQSFVLSEHVRCCEIRFSYWYGFQSRCDSLCTRVFQASTCS
jgi:hypothetical protein